MIFWQRLSAPTIPSFSSRKRLYQITRLLPIPDTLMASLSLHRETLPSNEFVSQNDQVRRKSMANRGDSRLLGRAQRYGIGSQIRHPLHPLPKHLCNNHLSSRSLLPIRAHMLPQVNIIHRRYMPNTVVTLPQLFVARLTLASRVRRRRPLCKRSPLVLRTGRSLSRKNLKMTPAHLRRTALMLWKSGKAGIRPITNIIRDLLLPRLLTSILRLCTMTTLAAEAG